MNPTFPLYLRLSAEWEIAKSRHEVSCIRYMRFCNEATNALTLTPKLDQYSRIHREICTRLTVVEGVAENPIMAQAPDYFVFNVMLSEVAQYETALHQIAAAMAREVKPSDGLLKLYTEQRADAQQGRDELNRIMNDHMENISSRELLVHLEHHHVASPEVSSYLSSLR